MFAVETIRVILTLLVSASFLGALILLKKKYRLGFTGRTVTAPVLGAVSGIALQVILERKP
ncbi:MAG: hypothetical protein LBD37_09095 [Treponema sp.]|jgi:L-cystine uptake protein TcyP (sodium:dicarboxylate symporter family)|nr:hypothetical protein [Treponema sp.]